MGFVHTVCQKIPQNGVCAVCEFCAHGLPVTTKMVFVHTVCQDIPPDFFFFFFFFFFA